jgi:hypothetical protein
MPAMFLCGDGAPVRAAVAGPIDTLDWEPFDRGGLAQALHLERMGCRGCARRAIRRAWPLRRCAAEPLQPLAPPRRRPGTQKL